MLWLGVFSQFVSRTCSVYRIFHDIRSSQPSRESLTILASVLCPHGPPVCVRTSTRIGLSYLPSYLLGKRRSQWQTPAFVLKYWEERNDLTMVLTQRDQTTSTQRWEADILWHLGLTSPRVSAQMQCVFAAWNGHAQMPVVFTLQRSETRKHPAG